MSSTVYDVRVRYGLTDEASRKIGLIEDRAKGAAKATGGLGRAMKFLAGGAVVGLGLRAAKSSLIDYNANLEKTAIGLRGIMQMSGISDGIMEAKRDADLLFEGLKQDAKASVGELGDFTAMASSLAGPVGKAGLGMEELRQITQGAVVASSALGIEAEQAALDIEQALSGTMSSKDRFARMLGMDPKSINKMNPRKRAMEVVKALNQPAVKQMAKEFEDSFAGQASTLSDNLKQALGKVGLPLMKRITAEIKDWNAWLDKNQDKVKDFADKAGRALVTGFNAVKDAILYLVEHRGIILEFAKAFLAFKGANMVGGAISGGVNWLASLGQQSDAATKGLAGFASKLGMAAGALGAIHFAAKGVADYIDKKQTERIDRTTELGYLKQQAGYIGNADKSFAGNIARGGGAETEKMQAAARRGLASAREHGLIGKDGQVKREKLRSMLGLDSAMGRGQRITGIGSVGAGTMNEQTARLDKMQYQLELMLDVEKERNSKLAGDAQAKMFTSLINLWDSRMKERNQDFATVTKGIFGDIFGWLGNAMGVDAKKKPKKVPNNMTVKVAKIEVVSDDPDKIAFGLVGAFQDLASNPTQSRRVIPGLREG